MSYILKFLYNILFLPLASLRLLYKIYTDKTYVKHIKERYGFLPNKKLQDYINNTDILIHVVSLGEFIAAERLISSLLVKNPAFKIVITCTTPTARSKIESRFNNNEILCCYLPYDNYFIIKKFINNLKPRIAIFVEKEIWPNLYAVLKKYNSKIVIVNATLSNRSFNSYRKINNLINNSISNIDYVFAQTSDDLDNFVKLGLKKNNINVYGNIKYDLDYPKDLEDQASYYKQLLKLENKLVLIAASTHSGEEEIILQSYVKLKKQYKDLFLILVPRHPHRFDEVYKLCSKFENGIIRYTEFKQINKFSLNNQHNKNILLLDTIGKLLYFYSISDIAFVGGSMINNIGCHNVLEPAMFKLPIIIGNNYFNFTTIVKNLNNCSAINIIANKDELEALLKELINNKALRSKQGLLAHNEFICGQGVLEKTLIKLDFFLKTT